MLLLSVAAVYAHTGFRENAQSTKSFDESTKSFDGMIMDVEELAEMHNLMTKGLNPELKEQVDILHDGCTSHFKS